MKLKLLKLDLRDAYARTAKALDDNARNKARVEYLQLMNQLNAIVADS
jgi:transcriptional antiterminator Rof (Rho-off)